MYSLGDITRMENNLVKIELNLVWEKAKDKTIRKIHRPLWLTKISVRDDELALLKAIYTLRPLSVNGPVASELLQKKAISYSYLINRHGILRYENPVLTRLGLKTLRKTKKISVTTDELDNVFRATSDGNMYCPAEKSEILDSYAEKIGVEITQ